MRQKITHPRSFTSVTRANWWSLSRQVSWWHREPNRRHRPKNRDVVRFIQPRPWKCVVDGSRVVVRINFARRDRWTMRYSFLSTVFFIFFSRQLSTICKHIIWPSSRIPTRRRSAIGVGEIISTLDMASLHYLDCILLLSHGLIKDGLFSKQYRWTSLHTSDYLLHVSMTNNTSRYCTVLLGLELDPVYWYAPRILPANVSHTTNDWRVLFVRHSFSYYASRSSTKFQITPQTNTSFSSSQDFTTQSRTFIGPSLYLTNFTATKKHTLPSIHAFNLPLSSPVNCLPLHIQRLYIWHVVSIDISLKMIMSHSVEALVHW